MNDIPERGGDPEPGDIEVPRALSRTGQVPAGEMAQVEQGRDLQSVSGAAVRPRSAHVHSEAIGRTEHADAHPEGGLRPLVYAVAFLSEARSSVSSCAGGFRSVGMVEIWIRGRS